MVVNSSKLIHNHSKYKFILLPKSSLNTNEIPNNLTYNSSIQHTTSQFTTKMINSHKKIQQKTWLPKQPKQLLKHQTT